MKALTPILKDRRQQKTRKAIFDALGRLLQKKCYYHITVKEILEEANIGRSTFYAHFDTREALLQAVCEDMFIHVLEKPWKKEEHHDFSSHPQNFENRLLHILYHLKENQKNVRCMLLCEDSELFSKYFKFYLRDFFEKNFSDKFMHDFKFHLAVGAFVDAIQWWLLSKENYTPEEILAFYLDTLNF